jgi:hypothetical protein
MSGFAAILLGLTLGLLLWALIALAALQIA